ncbi:MAG: hypothetical protein MK212_17785 [Saprospiraceae bacterium]|nr:hypothetical protein [Saprospiraceae bacterium]
MSNQSKIILERSSKSNFNFKQFVKSQITALAFEQLPQRLGISSNKLNRLFKNPECADLGLVKKFANLLETSVRELIQEYRLGFEHITLKEMDELRKAF